MELWLHPVGPEILMLMVMYPVEQLTTVMPAWRDFMATAPDELSCNGYLTSVPPVPIFPAELHGREVFGLSGIWCGDVAEGLEVVAVLRRLAEPLIDATGPAPYTAAQAADVRYRSRQIPSNLPLARSTPPEAPGRPAR